MSDTKSDTKVVTGRVRFSYAHVFEPWAAEPGQDKKYSVCLLIPKSDKKTLKRIQKAVEAAKTAGVSSKWHGKLPANLNLPLRDGDAERSDVEGYAGHYFINAKSGQRPSVVDESLNEILDTRKFYSGCYGRASVNFYAYDVSGNRGIACGLNHVQKLADGDFLDGRSRAEDDFADEYEGADDLLS